MKKQNIQQQTRWKNIFIVSGIILCIWYLASTILTNEESHRINSGVQLSQETKNALSQSSLTGVETDTGKRLETLANSGTAWGMSPFGTGKPLEEEKKPKVKFQKPNTQWKTRILSGVTYVFGEGNPREVALSRSQIETFRKSVSNKNDYGDYGYVTPSIEKSLREFLDDQNWKYFVYCFSQENYQTNTIPWEQRKNKSSLYIQDLVQVGFLDIESFLLIDRSTQRKELNTEKVIPLKWFLLKMVSPSEIPEGESELYSCTKKYGESLLEQISRIHKDYW